MAYNTKLGVGVGIGMLKSSGAASWTPSDEASCELWLPASDLVSVGDGNPLVQWNDSSGNDRHFTPSTGTPTVSENIFGSNTWAVNADGGIHYCRDVASKSVDGFRSLHYLFGVRRL